MDVQNNITQHSSQTGTLLFPELKVITDEKDEARRVCVLIYKCRNNS